MKKWMARQLLRAAESLDPVLIRTHIHSMVEANAFDLAQSTVMKYLTRERFLHCAFCPERFALRNVGKYPVCSRHIQAAKDAITKQEAAAAEPAHSNGGK